MRRTAQRTNLDWSLLGERLFLGALLLAVGGTMVGAIRLSASAGPVPAAGIVRVSPPVYANVPLTRPPSMTATLADASACNCSDPCTVR